MTINKEQPVSDARHAQIWDDAIECAARLSEAHDHSGDIAKAIRTLRSDAPGGNPFAAAAMKAAPHTLEQQQAVSGDVVAKERADWLLDAVACATQDRRFLRGDPAYDEIAGEAILLNGEKTISAALTASGVERMREALEAVEGAMLRGGDGAIGDFGWNITKLNKARPLIRTALQEEGVERSD